MSLSKIFGRQIALLTLDNTHLSATAGIVTSKLADGANFVQRNGSVPFTSTIAGIDPVAAQDLATKNYVDGVAAGLDIKQSVRAATTANLAALSGALTVDGVALVAGDRVLVKNQTTTSANGVYVVAAGAWARAADADTSGEFNTGAHFFVEQGTVNAATGWVLTTPLPIVLGTTALTFAQFSGAGTYSNGNGLQLVGTQFSLAATAAGSVWMGNGSSVATATPITGDITLSSAGLVTIGANVVTPAKSARQASGALLIGQGAGADVAPVVMSGDATLSETGVLTLAGGAAGAVKANDFIVDEAPTGAVNGVNTTYILANTPRVLLGVFVNGQKQEAGAGNDFTISGATITMLSVLGTGEKITVSYVK